ncbi:hypothetical protein Gorai_008945 [Gossypium raimondii]|uniref:Uncharacterized protein n=1 Tax=Gossypium raimondii TaxID=29730 RepID=A0A7J8PS88_GOSRA|nr:hypothetical protein [Gossypium raimondii]
MVLGVKFAEMSWDLSLWVQSRRALAMNSSWLREEGEGELGGNREGSRVPGNNLWDLGKNVGYSQAQTAMDHDLEYGVLIKEEGKKSARGRLKN